MEDDRARSARWQASELNRSPTKLSATLPDRKKMRRINLSLLGTMAPGATHALQRLPAAWRDIYKGMFDEGWDVYREKAIASQKTLGVIPAHAQLPARNPNIKAWASLPAEEKTALRLLC